LLEKELENDRILKAEGTWIDPDMGNPWLIYVIIFFRGGSHDETKRGSLGSEQEKREPGETCGENDDLLDDTEAYLQTTKTESRKPRWKMKCVRRWRCF
jgi:hypothetical protein